MTTYAYYEYVRDWPELIVAVYELERRLRTHGRPLAADILLKAFGELRDSNLALAKRVAAAATDELRHQEKATRVRPDTEGGGGKRLGDYLRADVLPEQNLVPGSIGVANKELLDDNVPWWPTNEEGSSAQVGRVLYGLFYGADDAAPPDSSMFREHPLFAPGSAPGYGSGKIENPIPARRFIEKSIPLINREWRAGFEAAKSRFMLEMDRALVTHK